MKTFATLVASVLFASAAFAQGTEGINIGFCNGDLPSSSDIACQESNTLSQAAIYLPAGTLHTFSGNSIAGIRAGLASKLNVKELTVWVRSELEGENLAEFTLTSETEQKIVKGWNDVRFQEPYKVSGSENGLYLGYTYLQKGPANCIAVSDVPGASGYFVKLGDGQWENRSASGTLFIEGMFEGESLPAVNLGLMQAELPKVIVLSDENVSVSGRVKNFAKETVTGFDVSIVVNGVVCGTARVECELPSNMETEFAVTVKHSIPAANNPGDKVTVLVDNINGVKADADMSDNEYSLECVVVERSYPRISLVEEFTTEQCVNCPRVAGYIHEALKREEFDRGVAVVCHHSGFGTDWLTTTFDEDYLWYFAEKNPAAPALMSDRKPEVENTCVYNPGSQFDMERIWRQRMAEPAFVSVNVSGEISGADSDMVKIMVSGERSYAGFCQNPVVTVYLVEDNIPGRRQAGGGDDYVHHHVNRAVNAVWGVPVVFDGNSYSYECTFELSSEWKRDNIEFVAAVSNFNEDNPLDCAVMNAGKVSLSDISSVEGIETDGDDSAVYYTLDGVKIGSDSLRPGIYVRVSGGKTQKVVVR